MIGKMLNLDPHKRPNINFILKDKLLSERIKHFLSNNEFKEEFAHTMLHKQNIFAKAQTFLDQ